MSWQSQRIEGYSVEVAVSESDRETAEQPTAFRVTKPSPSLLPCSVKLRTSFALDRQVVADVSPAQL